MTTTPHVCTYYCQDGLHAYACLCSLDYTAADVLQAAHLWTQYTALGDVVVCVFPSREGDMADVVQPKMIEVDPTTRTARDVYPVAVDAACYRAWVVLVRPQEEPPPCP